MTSKVAVFGAKSYDRQFLNEANKKLSGGKVQLIFYEERLNSGNTVLVDGCEVIICFVNDKVGAETVELLSQKGVKHISMRCAGYDNVDLAACKKAGITVSRVPAYSPYSVAEHALALMLALNRKIPKAFNKVREGDFSLKGLLGFDMHGKTCGVVGTGRIGFNLCKILLAMGCKVVAFDIYQSEEVKKAGVTYVTLDELLAQSDIISLHANLSESTRHMINDESIAKMKDGVMIINTSRGALLDTKAVIGGLKSKKIGYLGIDVYEFEQQYFFEDKSEEIVQDDILMRLTSFSNVIITAHQAYFTKEALENIATETISNVVSFVTTGTVKKENTVQ